MLLQGKTALVTGAANGIGLGIAQRLAQEGASIAIADRDEAHGAAAANAIERTGARPSSSGPTCRTSPTSTG